MNASLTLLVLSTLPAAPALGPPQFDTIPELRAAFRADQSSRRLDAVRFLRDGGWPRAAEPDPADRHQLTTDLLRLLGDPAADVRAAALHVLCAWQDSDQLTVTGRKAFVRALGPLVADKAHPWRVKLARRLAKFDLEQAPAAARALREALAGRPTEADRVEAAVGLAELSPDDKAVAVQALREVMAAGKDADARVDAARAVVPLDPAARPVAIKVCREVAAQGTGMAVLSAASALRKWKEVDAAEWSRLVAGGMERSPDPIDRGNLATALAVMRPEPKEAVPALVRVMTGTGAYARVKAAEAVLLLDPGRGPEVVPVARELLTDPDVRGQAAQVLGKVGPGAKDTLPDLRAALKECPLRDDVRRILDRVALLTAIGQVDPAGVPEAVAGLREHLRDRSDWARYTAVGAIGNLGPAAREAVPDLIGFARGNPSTLYRMGVARALGETAHGHREAEVLLREWAQEDDPFLRPAAEAALRKVTAKPDPK